MSSTKASSVRAPWPNEIPKHALQWRENSLNCNLSHAKDISTTRVATACWENNSLTCSCARKGRPPLSNTMGAVSNEFGKAHAVGACTPPVTQHATNCDVQGTRTITIGPLRNSNAKHAHGSRRRVPSSSGFHKNHDCSNFRARSRSSGPPFREIFAERKQSSNSRLQDEFTAPASKGRGAAYRQLGVDSWRSPPGQSSPHRCHHP